MRLYGAGLFGAHFRVCDIAGVSTVQCGSNKRQGAQVCTFGLWPSFHRSIGVGAQRHLWCDNG